MDRTPPHHEGLAAVAEAGKRPELRSSAAEGIGREGIATVWDDQGCYLGCIGVQSWERLLPEETRP